MSNSIEMQLTDELAKPVRECRHITALGFAVQQFTIHEGSKDASYDGRLVWTPFALQWTCSKPSHHTWTSSITQQSGETQIEKNFEEYEEREKTQGQKIPKKLNLLHVVRGSRA